MCSPTVFDQIDRRARKHHTCCECGFVIHPGDVYEETRGLWDGRWDTYKTCKS